MYWLRKRHRCQVQHSLHTPTGASLRRLIFTALRSVENDKGERALFNPILLLAQYSESNVKKGFSTDTVFLATCWALDVMLGGGGE